MIIVTDPATPGPSGELVRDVAAAAPLGPDTPPSPAAPSRPDGAKERIAAIMADKTHPYWKGDKQAVADMFRLHEAVHGVARDEHGTRLVPDPSYQLQVPLASAERRGIEAALHTAGVPPTYGQAIVDVFTGVRADLPPAPAEFGPMTIEEGARALRDQFGAAVPEHLARATAVVRALESLGPDVKDRIGRALSASGTGNSPELVRFFSECYDKPPAEQRRMVAQTFGLRAAEQLFGPAPRR